MELFLGIVVFIVAFIAAYEIVYLRKRLAALRGAKDALGDCLLRTTKELKEERGKALLSAAGTDELLASMTAAHSETVIEYECSIEDLEDQLRSTGRELSDANASRIELLELNAATEKLLQEARSAVAELSKQNYELESKLKAKADDENLLNAKKEVFDKLQQLLKAFEMEFGRR